MEKVDGAYTRLTEDQYAAGVMFIRTRRLPAEYGTEIKHQPNLYVKPMTDEDPATPEWDDKNTAEFEAEING